METSASPNKFPLHLPGATFVALQSRRRTGIILIPMTAARSAWSEKRQRLRRSPRPEGESKARRAKNIASWNPIFREGVAESSERHHGCFPCSPWRSVRLSGRRRAPSSAMVPWRGSRRCGWPSRAPSNRPQ
ncbi:hypothetical protein B0T18DRAFT_61993 [Schizothecium vesticola]|uniref:Uncharacterized protein n=1 Tax=Schizothecium vesticola TaxID=314040 RepID=A0AA40K9K1_9PEZI|nr:hypothetical protein B0T18DRAFT_61993 [Schizothecium vesticola]